MLKSVVVSERKPMKRKKAIAPWSPFEQATTLTRGNQTIPVPKGELIFLNSRYQVNIRLMPPVEPFGRILWLSIKRRDKRSLHDWRDIQRIKNELVGAEFEAVEIYPAESRLHDTANQYHLWVFADGYKLPIGFADRQVSEVMSHGSVQRPFEDKPNDLMGEEEIEKLSIYVKLVGQNKE